MDKLSHCGSTLIDFLVEQLLKPGFPVVVMIAEQVCDNVPKRIHSLHVDCRYFL